MLRGSYGRKYNGNYDKSLFQERLQRFRKYLKDKGYTEYTPSGNRSTIFDYSRWIEKICEREHISLEELNNNIVYYVAKYDIGGPEEEFGTKQHDAAKNALKRYKEYLQSN